MIKAEDANLAMVMQVAGLLGPLRKKVVFLGGAAVKIFVLCGYVLKAPCRMG